MLTDEVLVTGATGFIGKCLCRRMTEQGYRIKRALRHPDGEDGVVVGDIGSTTDWSSALDRVKVVVHLAARVHVMHDNSTDVLAEFRRVNVSGTGNLAQQAAEAGIRRFIFVSSIKVNGEQTALGVPFKDSDMPAPQDPYAISKWEAEQELLALAKTTAMDVVIIRPPLVYGPGVKANYLSLLRLLSREIPLPLGSIHNKRSYLALENLVNLITVCIEHPAAANQVFLAGDGEDLSTTELIRRLAKLLGKPAKLIPVPMYILEGAAVLVGKRDIARRLCRSLQVDISKARNLLGWDPPMSVDEGLLETVKEFLRSQSKQCV